MSELIQTFQTYIYYIPCQFDTIFITNNRDLIFLLWCKNPFSFPKMPTSDLCLCFFVVVVVLTESCKKPNPTSVFLVNIYSFIYLLSLPHLHNFIQCIVNNTFVTDLTLYRNFSYALNSKSTKQPFSVEQLVCCDSFAGLNLGHN